MNKRIHKRIMLNEKFNCYIYYDDEQLLEFDGPIEMYCDDISVGGMGVVSKANLKEGIVLVFTVTMDIVPYRVMGRVVKKYEILEDVYKYGLEFFGIPNGLLAEIKKKETDIIQN